MFICNCNKIFDTSKEISTHANICKKYTKFALIINEKYRQSQICLGHKNIYKCDCGFKIGNKRKFNNHLFNCEIFNEKEIDLYIDKLKINCKDLNFNEKVKICKDYAKNIIFDKKIIKRLNRKKGYKLSKDQKNKLKFNVKYYSIYNPFLKENCKLQGSWELRYALYLNENNIKWQKKGSIDYFYNNEKRKYFPDFYLLDLNEYHEIKGKLWTHKNDRVDDMEKMNLVKENNPGIKIKILMKKDLEDLGLDMNKSHINYSDFLVKPINLAKKKEKISKINKEIIINSNIDFSKKKWFSELSAIIGCTASSIVRWMRKNMKDFYEENCYKGKYVLKNMG